MDVGEVEEAEDHEDDREEQGEACAEDWHDVDLPHDLWHAGYYRGKTMSEEPS